MIAVWYLLAVAHLGVGAICGIKGDATAALIFTGIADLCAATAFLAHEIRKRA